MSFSTNTTAVRLGIGARSPSALLEAPATWAIPAAIYVDGNVGFLPSLGCSSGGTGARRCAPWRYRIPDRH